MVGKWRRDHMTLAEAKFQLITDLTDYMEHHLLRLYFDQLRYYYPLIRPYSQYRNKFMWNIPDLLHEYSYATLNKLTEEDLRDMIYEYVFEIEPEIVFR